MTRLSELAGKFNELVAGVNEPPYLDQFDHDYIKKLYDQINNPQKKNLKINKPIQKGIPGIAPDIELADHGIPTKDGQYITPSGYKGVREQMDFIPGKGLQFRIENEDGPPTYRPPTKQELEQYEHEVNPTGKNTSMKIGGTKIAGSYGQPSNMPDHIFESIQRQYGPGKGFGKYTIEDKKNVINWYKKNA